MDAMLLSPMASTLLLPEGGFLAWEGVGKDMSMGMEEGILDTGKRFPCLAGCQPDRHFKNGSIVRRP